VLKDQKAIAQYGDKGKNGVVIINTKKKEVALNNATSLIMKVDSSLQMKQSGEKVTIRNIKDPSIRPLYIIDGKVQGDKVDINTNEIESVTVLKDKSAVEKYGEKANNGVIEITTKRKKDLKEIPVSEAQAINKINGATVVRYNNDQEWLPATYSKNNPTELFIPRTDANIKQQEQQQEPIFTKVEYEPEFPGGDSAWKNYLVKNLQADLPLQEGWKPGVYKLVMTFIVKKDGTIADIKADDYAGTKTAEHCIDLIKRGPKWKPAIQNGLKVNCYRKQPITFVVPKK